ncbi:hypothetical protein [Noviherbaspirillum denitrificans]|uniref:Heat induced stress protein YflT n=1 Tax=Noviherbaspirillum denitrificans TaxID=1968433 RepID=A0A254TIA2_9BURK|nr:hypothetical protein [Noviherbaspirillum denitrificans]OWW21062.1 hypothetical protein AYR66_17855 [Noviherbaspirillum denitrificans]
MPQTLIRIYDSLATASHAREQLLASGFAPDSVHLDSRIDEAGPVDGNAVIEAKDTGTGPADGPLHRMFGVEERTDAYNNSEPAWSGSVMLTVDAEDEEQSARASGIMDRTGARSVDDFSSWRRHEG